MPAVTTREATERLTRAVEGMGADDLLDFHNEVFPRERQSELSSSDAGGSERRKILEYMARGLEVEEILDFWRVAFPETHHVSFDDETEMIQYSDSPQAVRYSES